MASRRWRSRPRSWAHSSMRCARGGALDRRCPRSTPAGLAAWLDDLLAVDPEARPATAMEALARLNAACGTSFDGDTAASRAARLASDPPAARRAELQELWSLLAAPAGPRVVWLTGPAGSGKSRVLRWLRTEAILQRWQVQVGLSPEAGSAEEGEPASALRAVENRPALLLLDEVESAPGRVPELLDRLARQGQPPPFKVVAGVRPGEITHRVLRRLIDDTGVVPTLHRLELGPLGEAGLRALAERASALPAVSDAQVRRLAAASEGSPLLAEALLVEEAGSRGSPKLRSAALERSSFAVRLGLLSARARAWLAALAVVGADVSGATGRAAGRARCRARPRGGRRGPSCRARPRAGAAGRPSRAGSPSRSSRASSRPRGRALHRRAAELLAAPEAEMTDPWRLARLWSGGRRRRARAAAMRGAGGGAGRPRWRPAGAAARSGFALGTWARGPAPAPMLQLRQAEALALRGAHEPPHGVRRRARLAGGAAERADAARPHGACARPGRPLRRARRRRRKQALRLASGPARERAPRARAARDRRRARAPGSGARPRRYLEQRSRCSAAPGIGRARPRRCRPWRRRRTRLERPGAEPQLLRAVELYRRLGHHGSELKSSDRSRRAFTCARTVSTRRNPCSRRCAARRRSTATSTCWRRRCRSSPRSRSSRDGSITRSQLSHEALDHARHLGDHNRVMVDRCRLAEALIGCGRPAQAVELLREALEEPPEQVEPDMFDSARMLLAGGAARGPGGDDRDIAALLERARRGFRERRKARPLLVALAIEMERSAGRTRSSPSRPRGSNTRTLAREAEPARARDPPRAELARARGATCCARRRGRRARGARPRLPSSGARRGRPALPLARRRLLGSASSGWASRRRARGVRARRAACSTAARAHRRSGPCGQASSTARVLRALPTPEARDAARAATAGCSRCTT